MSPEKEYVLGTHDEENNRLALQHRVWRPRALDAWRRAGFTVGQTILDIGCGPGYATVDLADIVGPSGRIVAIDRSKRFLDTLRDARDRGNLSQISIHQLDLDEDDLPAQGADGAWARWVFSFVKNPRGLLRRIETAVRPGGVLVLHEYFDYSTWRVTPRSREIEEFVAAVMESWRADGGEPDIGLDLAVWLQDSDFEIKTLHPIIDIVPASNFVWQWPKTFIEVGLKRLVDLEFLISERAHTILHAFAAREAAAHTLMITPGVLEIIAVRK